MFWNFMLMQTRPWLLWLKLYLGMCIPIVVYLQNTTGILIIITLIGTLVFLPKPSKLSYIDFSYHMVRGIFLELTGESKHYSILFQILLGNIIMKMIVLIIYLSTFIYSIYTLWNQNLLVGALLFYGLTTFEMSIASEYADISKNTIMNEKWDILISDNKY